MVSVTYDEKKELKLWEGIFVDIFLELSNLLNFSYAVTSPSDKQWGGIKSDGTWSGMIGQLVTKEVDIGNILDSLFHLYLIIHPLLVLNSINSIL